MIFAEGHFHPICGHGFWNGEFGFNTFCKLLGFQTGSLIEKLNATDDSMRVGQCAEADSNLTECNTGVCNDMNLGGACNSHPSAKCVKGAEAAIRMKCNQGKGSYSSCGGGMLNGEYSTSLAILNM